MRHDEGHCPGIGGIQMYYQRWQLEFPSQRAVIIMVHGGFVHSCCTGSYSLNAPASIMTTSSAARRA